MAISISSDQYYLQRLGVLDEYDSEQPVAEALEAGTSGVFFNFGLPVVGAYFPAKAVAFPFPVITVTDEGCDELPPNSDPPFPPVWPYVWDASLIYGRENLTQNLYVIRGNTLRFSFRVVQGVSNVDLTGASLTLSAKWSVTDSVPIFTCTIGDGITVTDAAEGAVDVVISSAKTSTGIPLHTVPLNYDVEMVDSDGNVSTVLYGILEIKPNVTTL